MIYKKYYLSLLILLLTIIFGCGKSGKQQMEEQLTKFIKDYETKVIPLTDASALAYFDATISGKKEDYDKFAEVEVKRSKIYTNKEEFALLKKIKESNQVEDELLKRQLEVLYNAYLRNQIDTTKLEKMIKAQSEIENKFSTFRAEVNGKKLTDNQIEDIKKIQPTLVNSKQPGWGVRKLVRL